MANFFEFTKVEAPDLSATATLMRNAGKSVKEAGEAFTAGADLIRNANIEKDTRIRNDNTAHWVNRINSAQSLEEVDSLREEISSDEFRNNFENDLYIDTNQLLKALDTRPDAIETRTRIAEGLRSSEQGEVVSAALLAIEGATSEEELDAILQDVGVDRLTLGNSQIVTSATSAKRANIQTKRSNNLRNQQIQDTLNDQKEREQYHRELKTIASSTMQKLLSKVPTKDDPTNKTTVADLEREVDSITTMLVNKYGYDPVTVEASVRRLLVGGFNGMQSAGIAGAVAKLSPDLQSKHYAQKVSLDMSEGVSVFNDQTNTIAKAQYPTAVGQLNSPPASLEQIDSVMKTLEKRNINTAAFLELPEHLKTEATLGILASIPESYNGTGEFKRAISTVKLQYSLLQDYETAMLENRTRFAKKYNTDKNDLELKRDSNLKAQARIHDKIAKAQAAGSDVSGLKAEIARLHTEFETISADVESFLAKPPNAFEEWVKSSKGVEQTLATINKSIKADGSVDNMQSSINQLMRNYKLESEELAEKGKEARKKAPKEVVDLILTLTADIEKAKTMEASANKDSIYNRRGPFGMVLPR